MDRTNKTPRGIRNNNPLNIERTGDKWLGMRAEQSDQRFVQFETTAYGYRAAIVILRNYVARYGLKTLRQVLHRWAPPTENNTDGYLSTVSHRAKILPDTPLNMWDVEPVTRLLEAMTYVECGQPGDRTAIHTAYSLLEQ